MIAKPLAALPSKVQRLMTRATSTSCARCPLVVLTALVFVHTIYVLRLAQNHISKDRPSSNSNNSLLSQTTRSSPRSLFDDPHTYSGVSKQQSLSAPSNVCLSTECLQHQASLLVRTYPYCGAPSEFLGSSSVSRPSWCAPASPATRRDTGALPNATNVTSVVPPHRYRGIILIKVPKAASSTSAGVAIRIGKRWECPDVQWMHKMGSEYTVPCDNGGPSSCEKTRLEGDNNNSNNIQFAFARHDSFVFTTIRNPASRALSSISFHVLSRSNGSSQVVNDSYNDNVTSQTILRELQGNTGNHYGAISEGQGGFQLRYTSFHSIPPYSAWSPQRPTHVHHPDRVVASVNRTLRSYDFVLVTERMDESLVALALILGIDVGSVLVTSSKVAGSRRFHLAKRAGKPLECLPIASTPKSPSPGVVAYLESDAWKASNYGDYLLWHAANQSLDHTIAHVIGRRRFEAALTDYRRWQALERQYCAPNVVFPCSDAGKPQLHLSKDSCYYRVYDFGCGYKCIDRLLLQGNATNPSSNVIQS